ncbi:malic enzyme [Zymobacter palmae]|uniref:malate dehydrogenase (oxaloacetate-decarboxylating) n=2 Tax=Zymobacter palmae TaxID=33074 RepID=A0A348HDD3_9GAMM|nr:NAD-dependent malic enzyme [Zymobacter palmae]BBG29635.1 malic enzyme [Zymobacter palmae]
MSSQKSVTIDQQGSALLSNPLLNKDTAFSEQERTTYGLRGLLPFQIETLDDQAKRAYQQFSSYEKAIDRHIYLRELQDRNETLFFRLVSDHLEEMLPIIYTPTVGEACQTFSHIYRGSRGLFIAYPDQDNIDTILANVDQDDVSVIVVTDGERILGLGDLGAGGMGIPIGKLGLYTACGGIDPAKTLPITLDVGTNNQDLLNDATYIGWHHERIRGEEYYNFVERFVAAVMKRWPNVLLQFEDFAQINALPLLQKYRDRLCCFNDDIQGTAVVALGTLYSACKARQVQLRDQRIIFVGAGSAGCGIAEQIVAAMQEDGLSEQEARGRIFMIDRNGLVTDDMKDIPDFQKKLAQPTTTVASWNLTAKSALSTIVEHVKPTILIGVSGQAGLFNEDVITTMYRHCPTPLVMPLSNPTSRIEAVPADILKWTQGNALVATGSPFEPVNIDGTSYPIAQCNNAYIFPGIGLGIIAAQAHRVTDSMLMAAARALSDCSPVAQSGKGAVLPSFKDIKEVSLRIAEAVAQQAVEEGVTEGRDSTPLKERLEAHFWTPAYACYG